MAVNKSISDAINLRREYIRKLAEQADAEDDFETSNRLWGEHDGYNWIVGLLDIDDPKLQCEFVSMTNKIYEVGKNSKN